MKSFWLTVLASATGQAIAFLLFRGFVDSYWGKNIIQEISRVFNKFCKHWRKENGK